MTPSKTVRERIIGTILGTAIGDALGLPYENLSRRRLRRMYPSLKPYRFIGDKGMVSDDTEHTCIVAQSLLASHLNKHDFGNELQWRLKRWFWLLPAGVGFGTLRALLKLSIGHSRKTSGVYSAGNGPAMRSAVIGVCCGSNHKKLSELVRISTEITHKDPKAFIGALAIALGASMTSEETPVTGQSFLKLLKKILPVEGSRTSGTPPELAEPSAESPETATEGQKTATESAASEFIELIEKAVSSIEKNESGDIFADSLGLTTGITGYIYHTVPVAIHVWLRHQDNLKDALEKIIGLGGDTDTTAAIVGALVGSSIGQQGIPGEYLDNLCEWPSDVKWMTDLGTQLSLMIESEGTQNAKYDADSIVAAKANGPEIPAKVTVPQVSIFCVLLRNVFFIFVVLFHVLRRMFPPY